MLSLHPTNDNPVWFDLLDPTPEEAAAVEARVGVALPDRASLEEIESSSRLRAAQGALIMSMPVALRDGAASPRPAPLGFVLTPTTLVTIRYGRLPAFETAALTCRARGVSDGGGIEAMADLTEEMVDRLADVLETVAGALSALSIGVFSGQAQNDRQIDRQRGGLRDQLLQVGRLGEQSSDIRDALAGLGRIVGFVTQRTADWPSALPKARLESVRADIVSLADYESHLTGKVQFLMDALVGMIGIAQNEIFKVLTIVSIVGIPPTLIASIYGMNFKIMPELHWDLGYPYALTMIVLSAILPLAWFKWRRWF